MRVYPNPSILLHRHADREGMLVADVLAEGKRIQITDPQILRILGRASGGVDRRGLVGWIAETLDAPAEAATALYQQLRKQTLLVSEDRLVAFASVASSWYQHDWGSAFRYFCSTLDQEYDDIEDATEEWVDRVNESQENDGQRQGIYKEYPEAESVNLEKLTGDLGISASDALCPSDGPDESPLDKSDLSAILFYTFGEMDKLSTPRTGDYLLKTSPSGGARHPTEAYVVVEDVENVRTGVYHYSVAEHELERLDASSDEVFAATEQPKSDVKVLIVLSSVVYRTMLKYTESRAFQIINQDIGHLIETLRIICDGHQRKTRFSERCDAATLSQLLSLDEFAEPIFGYVAIS